MIVAAAVGVVLVVVWLVVNLCRSRRVVSLRADRQAARNEMTAFAETAKGQGSVGEIAVTASEVGGRIFGGHRFVLIQSVGDGWVTSQPIGPPPPPIPSSAHGLLAWFRYNDLISCESDLLKSRFGAMRAPLQSLMDIFAVDVLVPLVHQGKLLALVGMALDRKPNALDRELLRIFRLELTVACANVRLHNEASHLYSLVEEVDLASTIELAMVPKNLAGSVGALEWVGYFGVAGKAGSDFFGVYPLRDERIMIVMGDAVGRELAGSLVAAAVKSCCDQAFEQTPDELNPGQLLALLNTSLYRPNQPALSSCCAVLFDPQNSLIHYANAGHPQPYCLTTAGVRILGGSGPLLGDVKSPDFTIHQTPLHKGDTYIFLTDGLLSPQNDGSDYGYRRFHRFLRKKATSASIQMKVLQNEILSDIISYSSDDKLRDDQALLIVSNT